jgi:type I restriction enzyme M protein
MISGYNRRDVVNLLGGIHFDSSDAVHTLGRLYETLLREMRGATGDSGEFYTPRSSSSWSSWSTRDLARPCSILPPALADSSAKRFLHLMAQAKTTEDVRTVQERSIFGAEPKPLLYLLCQMNLLLHWSITIIAEDLSPCQTATTAIASLYVTRGQAIPNPHG